MALVCLFASSGIALADDAPINVQVTGGTRSQQVNATGATIPVTIASTLTTQSTTFTDQVNNLLGDGTSWKITVAGAAASFGGHTLVTKISNATSACAAPGSCIVPTSNVSYSNPVVLDGTHTFTIINAAANTGMGSIIVTPTVQVDVPPYSYAGTYGTTLDVVLASGL